MRLLLACLVMVASAGAFACGYCVEDKIAAVYDHDLISRALADKHQVVFMHVDGTATKQALERAANASPIDRGSVRISADLLTVAFTFDAKRASLGAIHSAMERRLRGVSLMPFQIMDKPGDLKTIKK